MPQRGIIRPVETEYLVKRTRDSLTKGTLHARYDLQHLKFIFFSSSTLCARMYTYKYKA